MDFAQEWVRNNTSGTTANCALYVSSPQVRLY